MFLWRACKNIIPTFANLRKKKKIVESDLCPICCQFSETAGHVLWKCEAAKDVWCKICKSIQKFSFSNHSFLTIWQTLANRLSLTELAEAAMVFKGIWMRRNEVIYKHNFLHLHPDMLLSKARNDLTMFLNSQSPQVDSAGHLPVPINWSTPPPKLF